MTPGARALLTKQANGLTDWMRGDGQGIDWRYGLLGPPALNLAAHPIFKNYQQRVIGPAGGAPVNASDRRLMRNLKSQQGIIREVPGESMAGRHQRQRATGNRNAAHLNWMGAKVNGGSNYHPLTHTVSRAKGQRGPGLLAHELGHATGGKGMMVANVAGKNLHGLGIFGALASSDQNTAGAASAVGTAGGLSTLVSEMDASRRGFKMLRGAGGSRAQALKAFIGVPTYALGAAMPWLAYKGKEMMGGFKHPKQS